MKTISTVLAFFISVFVFGQSETNKTSNSDKNYKLENVKISIEVNSKADLESIEFNKIETLLDDLADNKPVFFEIICSNENTNSSKENSFKISLKGNSNNKEAFLKRLNKMKKTALNFYN